MKFNPQDTYSKFFIKYKGVGYWNSTASVGKNIL